MTRQLHVGGTWDIFETASREHLGYVKVLKILDCGNGVYAVTMEGQKGPLIQVKMGTSESGVIRIPPDFPYFTGFPPIRRIE